LISKGVVGVRRIDKQELRRIARSCGATILTTMATDDEEGGESFEESLVGTAGVVYEDTVGDMDYMFIEVFSH
jgi:T-complex protein 1 subunit alpha